MVSDLLQLPFLILKATVKRSKFELYAQIIIIIFIFILSSKIPQIFYSAFTSTLAFLSAEFSYNRLRLNDPVFLAISEAKRILPKDGRVNVSPNSWAINRIKARYALYPIKLSEEWDYFIDIESTFEDVSKTYKKQQLSSGVIIFAKPERTFVHRALPAKPANKIMVTIIFISIHIFFVFFGSGIMSLAKISKDDNGLFWYLSTSYIIGFLILTIIVWLFLLAGFDLKRTTILLFWAVALFSIFFFRSRLLLENWRNSISLKKIDLKAYKRLDILALSVLVLIVVLPVILSTGLTPVSSWDAMSKWILKSKIMFQEKNLVFDYTHHNHYPILWPLIIAIQFSLIGGSYAQLAKFNTALLIIVFIIQLAGGFKFLRINHKWTCILILLYFACFFHKAMTYALPETSFLVFFTGCLTAIMGWAKYQHDRRYILLIILMAIGLTLVKFEGGVASAIIGLSIIVAYRKNLSSKKVMVTAFCLLAVPILEILWIIWNKSAGYLPVIDHLSSELSTEKLVFIAKQSIRLANKSNISNGLFAGLVFAALLKLPRNLRRFEEILVIASFGMILFCGVAVIGWNIEDIYKYDTGTLSRLFLHSTPALIILLGSILAERESF